MWDLQQIIAQNNQAAIGAMMAGQKTEDARSPEPEAWSLTVLAEKLRIGPPLLSELMAGFVDIDTMTSFLKLIRMLLPEHEDEIMSEPRNKRVYRFCYLFGKRYYPLPAWSHDISMKDFADAMPVEIKAMSYSAYHELELRPGYLMLLSLVIYPYEGDERDQWDDDVPFNPFDPMKRYAMEAKFGQIANAKETKSKWRPKASDIAFVKNLMEQLEYGGRWFAPMGFIFIKIDDQNIELRQADNTPEVRETVRRTCLIAEKIGLKVKVKVGKTAQEKTGKTLMEIFSGARVPLIDKIQHIVGEEVARHIPSDGWTNKELHLLTDGTRYDGVGDFADWACSETGCVALDTSHDDVDYMEGWGEPLFKWTERNVQMLTEDWPKVKKIREKIDHMVEWLEADPHNRFQTMLQFLMAEAKQKIKGKKAKREPREYDPTEHWCPLDQVNEEEEEENDIDEDWGSAQEGAGVQVREITPEEFVAGTRL